MGNEGGIVAASSSHSPPTKNFDALADQTSGYFFILYFKKTSFILLHYFRCWFWISRTRVAEKESGQENLVQHDVDEVRPPLPVIREALYDDAMLYGYDFSVLFGFAFNFKELFFGRKVSFYFSCLFIIHLWRFYCFMFRKILKFCSCLITVLSHNVFFLFLFFLWYLELLYLSFMFVTYIRCIRWFFLSFVNSIFICLLVEVGELIFETVMNGYIV